jgi:hypothetical protein
MGNLLSEVPSSSEVQATNAKRKRIPHPPRGRILLMVLKLIRLFILCSDSFFITI